MDNRDWAPFNKPILALRESYGHFNRLSATVALWNEALVFLRRCRVMFNMAASTTLQICHRAQPLLLKPPEWCIMFNMEHSCLVETFFGDNLAITTIKMTELFRQVSVCLNEKNKLKITNTEIVCMFQFF